MNVVVALEHRFNRLPNGSVWTDTFFSRSFFERYLEVFTSVSVVARVRDVDSVAPNAKRVNGDGVTVVPISYYVGPWDYLHKMRQVRADIARAAKEEGAVIFRASSQIGNSLEPHFRSNGRPYGLEVVVDPYDMFSPGSVRHPLRPFFRWWFPRILRRQCARACATSYVTAHALQKRYPPTPDTFTTNYSSVELGLEAFASRPHRAPDSARPFRVLMVGSLALLYKAPDVMIRAFASCRRRGLNAELHLLGEGRETPLLRRLTSELGVGDHVHFLGAVPGGEAVREHLDSADLFVLPSRQEGLPRAMIEAMARGLPCIGSTVGGIPELLEPDYLVRPNDPEALADKIYWFRTHPEHLESAAARNLEKAKEYSEAMLSGRRHAFYSRVREVTALWMEARKRHSVGHRPVSPRESESTLGGSR